MSLQKVTLIGKLGQDPDTKYTGSGTMVCNFSVATTETISKQSRETCPDGWVESYNKKNWELTTWWKITAWRKLAEICSQYLEKGREVYIEGQVSGTAIDGKQYPRVWTGRDGVARANFEVTARVVKFLGSNGGSSSKSHETRRQEPAEFVEEEYDF